MIKKERLTPKEIIQSIKDMFTTNIQAARIEKRTMGKKKTEFYHLWIRLDKTIFKEAVRHLQSIDPALHFAVASGYDLDDTIELVYSFSLYHGVRHQEISVNLTVALQKSDPTIETITDLIPGSLISEQEKQEMLGITVRNIPKNTRVFIADDFPKGVYPWRRDETGPKKLIRNLHKVKS
ncbi:MAG: NADH-quinone oxidoreductase subunit C [Euryarchaeota archaeon]|nr:NADH-quinone oxidoreductase subunit C [Euryarchaeota archaeon]